VGIAMIIERDGMILIGKRAKDKDFGSDLWEIPSGRLDQGEDPEDAIQREAMEELGIEVKPRKIIDAYGFSRADQDMILLTYLCDHEGQPRKSAEHQELRWVSPEEAIHLFEFDLQQTSIRKYLQAR